MSISPARTSAFDILLKIEAEGAFSSILLSHLSPEISALDRSLCHEIVLGTLRQQMYLDRVLAVISSDKKVDMEVRIVIRMGLFQLLSLDRVPAYSAINESVSLVQRAKKTSAKGFVNAILRRASRENIEIEYADDLDRLSVESSHPRWLIERWIREFGSEKAKKITERNNQLPPLSFRSIGTAENSTADLERLGTRSMFVDGCYIGKSSHSGEIFRLAREDQVYIQDEASQMAAHCVDLTHGGNFIDICASPGGKTGIIAQKYSGSAKLFVGGDLSKRRVALLRDNLERQGIENVSIVRYDAEGSLPFAHGSFDRVLLDAPCSGTGTIRRNPEIRYRLSPDDLARSSAKQLSMLQNASKLVRPRGEIIYSTCSIEIDENEDVCKEFLAGHSDFAAVSPMVSPRFLTDDGFARTRPDIDEMDGFFIARLRRVSES